MCQPADSGCQPADSGCQPAEGAGGDGFDEINNLILENSKRLIDILMQDYNPAQKYEISQHVKQNVVYQ